MKAHKLLRSLRILLITFASAACIGGLSSCNTTRGFGEDLQKVGREIEQEANEKIY